MSAVELRVHRVLHGSRANGPGSRAVVWLQGCPLNCPGCFNPETHDAAGGTSMSAASLADALLEESPDGITISGGEPFAQPEGLLELLRALRKRKAPPVLVFSGYTEAELRADPAKAACLSAIDALICGPFRADEPAAYERFCSSGNQRLVLLTDRMRTEDFAGLPLREIIIGEDGTALFSGIAPVRV